jgi:hypothetical protein
LQPLSKQLSPYISNQPSVTCISDIGVSLKEVQNLICLSSTSYTAAESLLCCQTNNLMWLRCSVDSVCVRSNPIARCEKCDVGMCIPGASRIPHNGEI